MRTFLAVLLALLTAPANAESWQPYRNDSVGFSVALPTSVFEVEEDTAARLSLSEVGGEAQLDVFGVINPDLSAKEFRALIEAADSRRRITYRASGRSWFVLSGYLDGEPQPTIFYAKFMLNAKGTALSAFEISYPADRRAAFAPLVERMEDSLTSPR